MILLYTNNQHIIKLPVESIEIILHIYILLSEEQKKVINPSTCQFLLLFYQISKE